MLELTASLEDYLEAIWIIGLEKKIVRVKDIARLLQVKAASVIGALKILAEKELVIHERYGYVELTKKGVVRAKKIFERHKILTKFFHEILGLSLDVATEDACRIEHHMHKETVDRLVEFMEFIETYPFKEKTGFSNFGDFVKKGAVRAKSHQKTV